MQRKRFRVHHILCTVLYRGEGYSGAFCENMTEQTNALRVQPDELLLLVTDADDICARCPNKTADDGCGQDGNRVKDKDKSLLQRLALSEGENYTYRELLGRALEMLDAAAFLESCGNCRWYRQGLCSYEQWKQEAAEIARAK